MFNHESPRRGETFVTRKITRAVARIKLGIQNKLYLGNLNAKRDWSHSKNAVEMMWLMLQQDKSDDFIIASGEQHSVREFCEIAFKEVGIDLEWNGEGANEKGVDKKTGKIVVEIDPKYFRPSEVESLLGDSTKAREKLGWSPKVSFRELIKEMVEHDLEEAKKDIYLQRGGFKITTNLR